jgi:hypothetical protein
MAALILLCIAVILLGAIASPHPAGWVALALAVIAMLMTVLKWSPF